MRFAISELRSIGHQRVTQGARCSSLVPQYSGGELYLAGASGSVLGLTTALLAPLVFLAFVIIDSSFRLRLVQRTDQLDSHITGPRDLPKSE